MVRDHVGWTQELAGWVAADDRFEIVAPHPLDLVCFAHRRGGEATDAMIAAANASGAALFTRSVADGRTFVRVCVGGRMTERRHVEAAWALLQSRASALP
jgi:aromatic-L-amino-acid decarboxylase